ncbi:MAG TPA: hypothetical protein VFG69_11505 [Nannocystaceae bacterium]|nr:hypothetical protein [Nannocystaceae bacterium]
MNQVKSKRNKLNLEVRTGLGAEPELETDLEAHSSPLDDEELAEVAAYGATRSCPSRNRGF